MLAGAAGLVVVAGDDDRERPAAVADAAAPATQEPGGDRLPMLGETQTGKPQPPAGGPAADPDAIYNPSVQPAREDAGPVTVPSASRGGAEVTFIVRLKGPPEIDTISRSYKSDRAKAEQAYADLSDRLPGLKEFRLVGASYSGELKLAYRLAPDVEPTRAVINGIKDKIMAIEGVAYADPDYVAHPGED